MENFKDQEGLSNILPYDFVKENDVLAFSDGDSFSVISPNNLSDDIYHEIQRFLKSNFSFSLCKSDYFNDLLTSSFSINKDSTLLSEELTDEFDLQSFAGSISATEDLLSGSNDTPIIKLINGIISQAVKNRASDIHFEPYEDTLIVRFRVDGILKEILKQDSKISSVLISRIKIISGLDISERRLPQDGRVSLSLGDKDIDVRVSTLPSSYGERIVLRLLDKQASQINIDDLGLPSVILKNYKSSLKNSEGIILFTGPTGSGKTTTLYSGLRYLSDSSQNILTVEDPIEYAIEGIGQTQVNTKVDMTFARGLRAILRQDPDVVMIGEIRDLETAEMATQAALTGHLVLSTLHTNDAPSAITRLMELGIPPYLIRATVIGVMAQRLVRTLCEECKTPIDIQEEDWKMLTRPWSTPLPKQAHQPVGCLACRNTGYRGRAGVYEIMPLSENLKEYINEQGQLTDLRKNAIKEGMHSLRLSGANKIAKGQTTIEEVLRVTPSSLNSKS
mgnify:CR=1 FL=1